MTAALASITTAAPLEKDGFESEIKSYLASKENFGLEKPSPAILKKIHEYHFIRECIASNKKLSAVDIRKLEKQVCSDKIAILEQQKKIIEDCVAIYNQAQNSLLPFLIGDSSLRDNEELLKNFGVLAADDISINKSIAPLIPNIKTGSVFAPHPWSLTRNDCFMLGSTRSNHPFYIAKKVITAENLWNTSSGKMTTLGREICILHFSGYIQGCPEELIGEYGYSFIKDEKEKKPCLSITELDHAISKIKEPETILGFLKFIKKK